MVYKGNAFLGVSRETATALRASATQGRSLVFSKEVRFSSREFSPLIGCQAVKSRTHKSIKAPYLPGLQVPQAKRM